MGMTTLDLEPAAAEAIVQAALTRHLITEAEVDAARAAAEQSGKSVVAVLVEDGLIAQRSIDGLAGSLGSSGVDQVTRATRPRTPAPSGLKAPSSIPVVPGYELLSKLGEGGMGAVWRARQLKVGNREVALKVISAPAADDEAKARFRREGEAAAAVNHENVIRIFDLGETPDGRPFMALELVPGGDAQKLCDARGGRLGEAEALALVRDAARGAGALAEKGLVHRDIKPANIFIGAEGRAKLADLGLARQATGDDRMTASGMIVGTPAFMSPEQASAQRLDVRTDIYALGATLYALVTGRPPFVGRTALVVVAKVLNEEAPDPRDLAPALSAGTARVIARALSKDPRARFQTADELVDALQRALAAISGRVPREVPPPRPSGRVITAPKKAPNAQTAQLPASGVQPPSRVAAPIALGLALALGILGGAAALRGRATPPSPPAPPRLAKRDEAPRPVTAPAPAPTETAAPPRPVKPLAGVEDTWAPPSATARSEPASSEPAAEPDPVTPRARPLGRLSVAKLNQGWSDGGRVQGDPGGCVMATDTKYFVANSAPLPDASEVETALSFRQIPPTMWWSVVANPADAPEQSLIGDTPSHAIAVQVRLTGDRGEAYVWLLGPGRARRSKDVDLSQVKETERLELPGLRRWGGELKVGISVADGWRVTLTQGGLAIGQASGSLPAAADRELSQGLRLFSGVCSHGEGTLSAVVKAQAR